MRVKVVPLANPRERYLWPATLPLGNDAIGRRGLRQLDTVPEFLERLKAYIAGRSTAAPAP